MRSVAVASHDASRTGAPISLLRVWGALRAAGEWSPSFLCLDGGPLLDQFTVVGPTRVARPAGRVPARVRAALSAEAIERFDRLAASRWLRGLDDPAALYINTVTLGHLADVGRQRGLPVITHVHEMEQWIVQRVRPNLVALTVAHSDLLIAASEAVRRNLIDNHDADPDRTVTVYETTNRPQTSSPSARERVRSGLELSSDDTLVIGVGTLDWRKGADLFLQVAINAAQAEPRIHFAWMGLGDQEAVHRWRHDAQTSGFADRIHYLGEQTDPADYYAAADIFCLTSREDPYPLVMLEAAAAGLPVIGFRATGGVEEFLREGGGLLADYLNVAAMGAACMQLTRDPTERGKLGGEAKRAAERHTPGEAATRIAELLGELAR